MLLDKFDIHLTQDIDHRNPHGSRRFVVSAGHLVQLTFYLRFRHLLGYEDVLGTIPDIMCYNVAFIDPSV